MRVHPEILKAQKLPAPLVGKGIWDERLADIAHFEDYATRQGTKILKFFLHVSHKEQKKRFLKRLDEPDKNWKFSASDVKERKFWDDYMHAFEEAIGATASKHAPWFVVPADNRWFTRLIVAAAIVDGCGESRPHIPEGRRGEEEGACGRACGAVPRAVVVQPESGSSGSRGRTGAARAFARQRGAHARRPRGLITGKVRGPGLPTRRGAPWA